MDTYRKRSGYTFKVDDGQAQVTIFRPIAETLLKKGVYIIIYERADGYMELNGMTKQEIAERFIIDHRDLENV